MARHARAGAPRVSASGPCADELAAAAGLCRLGSRLLLKEVDRALYRQLEERALVDAIAPLGLHWLEPTLRELGEERALEELAVEYCRLFVGPLPACAPYESVQRGSALIGGRARARLEAFLGRQGLVLADGLRLASADHLAVHLAVLGELCTHASGEALAEFLSDHVRGWMPEYLRALAASAVWAPYTTIAVLLAEFLDAQVVEVRPARRRAGAASPHPA